MKRLFSTGSIIAISLFLVFPVIVSAQIISGGDHDRPFLALEASANYFWSENTLDEVNDGIQTHIDHQTSQFPGLTLTPSLFEEENNYDYRLGFRLGNLHVGGLFTELKEYSAGFSSESYYTQTYELAVKTREFSAYVGYMHPITHWLEIGAYYSYGNGDIKGTFFNEFDVLNPELTVKHEIKGDYNPSTIEARARLNITKFIALDFAAGKKMAETDMVVIETGLDSEYALADANGNPMKLDWSGNYYSVGLTLMNPYGK